MPPGAGGVGTVGASGTAASWGPASPVVVATRLPTASNCR